jgi:hypothetical protein
MKWPGHQSAEKACKPILRPTNPKKNPLQIFFQTLKTSYSTKQKKNQKKEQQQQWITQEKHAHK